MSCGFGVKFLDIRNWIKTSHQFRLILKVTRAVSARKTAAVLTHLYIAGKPNIFFIFHEAPSFDKKQV